MDRFLGIGGSGGGGAHGNGPGGGPSRRVLTAEGQRRMAINWERGNALLRARRERELDAGGGGAHGIDPYGDLAALRLKLGYGSPGRGGAHGNSPGRDLAQGGACLGVGSGAAALAFELKAHSHASPGP